MVSYRQSETVKKLGAKAKEFRRDKGLTQEELARKANVSRSFVIDFENGHPRAELGKVILVMQALGLDLTVSPHSATGAQLITEEKTVAFADILNSQHIVIDQATRKIIEHYIAGDIEIDDAFDAVSSLPNKK